jgi:hypothetical protein
MNRGLLIACTVFFSLACASTVVPTADTPVDWADVADERVPVIVTQDPDGDERVTKIWLVVVDGQALIRTGNTRWFRNIERDPNVVFRVGGYAYPLRAERVTDESLRKRAHAAFRKKHPWMDRLLHPFGEPDANVMRLTPRE